MRTILLLPILTILLSTMNASAQESAEHALATALVLEETAGKEADALASYRAIWDEASTAESVKVRAGLGVARCLRRLGKIAEAKEHLDAVRKSTKDEALLRDLEAEAAKLAKVSAPEGGGSQDEFDARVLKLARAGQATTIVALGDGVLDAIGRVFLGQMDVGDSEAKIISTLTEVLVRISKPEATELLAKTLESRTLKERGRIIHSLNAMATQQDPSLQRLALRQLGLIRIAQSDPDPLVRTAASSFLGNYVGVTTGDFRTALADSSASVRHAAFLSMLNYRSIVGGADFAEFAEALSADPATELRVDAAQAQRLLVELGRAATAEKVAEKLLRDPEAVVRLAALNSALGHFGEVAKRSMCLRMLNDPDAEIRRAAVNGLRPTSVDAAALRDLLKDPDQQVRQRVVGQLQSGFAAEVVCDGPEAEAVLAKLLADGDRNERSFAGGVLAKAGSKAVAESMLTLLSSGNVFDRQAAAYHVIRHDLRDAAGALIKALPGLSGQNFTGTGGRSFPSWNRGDADSVITWLRESNDKANLLLMLAAADTLETQHTARAAHALARLVTTADRAELFAAFDAIKDDQRRVAVVEAFAATTADDPRMIAMLEKGLGSTDSRLRRVCAQALLEHGGPKNVPRLIEALLVEKGEAETVDRLAQAVAKHADAAHLESLARALEGAEPERRAGLLNVIGRIESPEATKILVDRIDGPDTRLAVQYLSRRATPEALAPIIALLASEKLKDRRDDRFAALQAVRAYGTKVGADVLLDLLKRYPEDDTSTHGLGVRTNPENPDMGGVVEIPIALLALFEQGHEAYLAAVRAIVDGDYTKTAKRLAATLLCRIDTKESDDLIRELLTGADAAAKAGAARAVGEALIVDLAPTLRRLVRSTDSELRRAAETSLQRFQRFGL